MHNKKKWKQFLCSAVAIAMSSAMAISVVPVHMISAAENTQTEATTETTKTETNTAKENVAKTITPKALGVDDAFTSGDLNYKVLTIADETTSGTVAVTGYKDGADMTATTLSIPETVTDGDNVSYKVTTIGTGAFGSKTNITTLNIGDNVTKVEDKAFDACSNITTMRVPVSMTIDTSLSFRGCEKVADVTFSKGCNNGVATDYDTSNNTIVNNYKYTPWYQSRNTVNELKVTILNGVKRIANGMFYGSTHLSVLSDETSKYSFPDSVESVGDYSFRECGIKEMIMPDSVTSVGKTTFYSCKNLSKVTLSNNISIFGENVFNSCSTLSDITIPMSLNLPITLSTFKNATNITKIKITAGDKSSTNYSVTKKVEMPWYITNKKCTVTIDDNITSIAAYAFQNATNVSEVIMPDSVKEIGDGAFYGCTSLASAKIPNNIKVINTDTFQGCTNLSSVNLPNGLESINKQAFINCSLSKISFPESLKTIGEKAFCINEDVYGLEELVIPKSVNSIATQAFLNNTNLKTVVFQGDDLSLSSEIFRDCYNLESVTLPKKMQQIPDSMFMNCNFTSAEIPDSVSNIGANAFYGNNNLTDINFTTANVSSEDLTIGANAFNNGTSTADATLNISKGYKKITNSSGVDIKLSAPSLFEGYNFGGWFSDETCETAVSSGDTTLATDNTIYTKWTLGEYSVLYYPNGGKVDEDEMVDTFTYYDGPIPLPTATRSGYTFVGWYTNKELTEPISEIPYGRAENLAVYAKWVPTTYNILYELDGGNSVNNPAKYSVETSTFFLMDSTRKGYTFDGWYSDSSLTNRITSIPAGLTGDKIFYAKWNLDTYNINYQLNGGSNGYNPSTYNVNSSNINFANPMRSGYTFAGWYRDSACTNRVYSIPTGSTGDMTIYAKWSKVSTGKVSSPKTSSVKKKSFVYKYKKVSGAKGYQITYAKNSKMTKGKKIVYTSSTKKTISKLKRKTTYYVRVRAYKLDSKGTKIYGKYSSKKKVRTK